MKTTILNFVPENNGTGNQLNEAINAINTTAILAIIFVFTLACIIALVYFLWYRIDIQNKEVKKGKNEKGKERKGKE